MKTLTAVRLINWHRFENETIEFSRSVLISGENGAGKSTILDAIQFVCTCSKAHFNKAAHEKGHRTLNSYIRCKTGKEDHPYERTGSLSAHICLEFYEEERGASFLAGVVMDSATEEKEPNVCWYVMEKQSLSDNLFFQGDHVKSISQFRSTNRIRQEARTVTEAKKMMLARFGRLENKFFSLIPKALAFKPIHDIKDFVYSYVLDEKQVNIEALRENVRSYQELEQMLQDVRRRIAELEEIDRRHDEVENYLRIDRNHEYYIARSEKDRIQAELLAVRAGLRTERVRQKQLIREREQLTRARDGKERTIRDLSVELQADSEYQAYQELDRKRAGLEEVLREDRRNVAELEQIAQEAADRMEQLLRELPDSDPMVPVYRDYRTGLRGLRSLLDLTDLQTGIQQVLDGKKKLQAQTTVQLADARIREAGKTSEQEELAAKIRMLEARKLVYRPEVLELQSRIREQFRRLERSGDARILCEQLEISDPAWRNAVEGYLNTQRFYLLTDPEDFDVALSVYERMRQQRKVYGVGLINTEKLEAFDEAPAGSLAACVTSGNPWARRYVNMVLGKVHCCKSYQELKQYPTSITRECMRYQNHVVSAISPKVFETPYIGANAYIVQLEQCRRQKQTVDEELAAIRAEIRRMERMLEPLGTTEDVDVKFRLKDLETMRAHEAALSSCEEELKQLRASRTMMQKQLRLNAMEEEKKKLDLGIERASADIGRTEEKILQMETRIAEEERQIAEQSAYLAQLAEALGEEAAACEKEYLRISEGKDPEEIRQNYEAARKGNRTRRERSEQEMIDAMRRYKTAHDFGAADSMEGYPAFRAEHQKLRQSQLLEYEDKVARARNAAEAEFREQFLARLQENIRQAQAEFRDLNKALADIRFSREHYEFRYEARKNLRKFYDMIMDDFNLATGASLFSGTFNETHREAIEELFEKLMIEDERSEQVLEEYTDYRTYMDYDIRISFDDGSYMYYSKVSREKSGGETQTPFYITIAASFIQLYRNSIGGDAIGLVMMDEAFNNMDDSRMEGVLSFMHQADLQTIIAAPPEKIQYIAPAVDSVLLVLTDGELSYVEDFTHEAV